MNEQNEEIKEDKQPDLADSTEQSEQPSKLKQYASRQNLITAGALLVALGIGLIIGLQFAGDKTDGTSQQPFSTQVKDSSASQSNSGDKAAGSTTPGSKNNTNGGSADSSSLAPSGGGSTTTNSNVATTDIAINSNNFSPATVTVKKGSRVTWTNKDSGIHALDRADGTEIGPHSQQLAKGESYTYSYSTVGTYKYLCILHSNMTGTVIVTD